MPDRTIAISTGTFYRQPLEEGLRRVAEAGFQAVEVMVTQDPTTQEPHLLREATERHGLSIVSIHAPFLLVTRRVWGTDPMGKVYRAVHLAEEVGAPLVVVHPPYHWQVKFRRWCEQDLLEFSARAGVTVAVENMFPIRFGERGVRFHAGQEFEDLERYPYLVLDTSHAAVSNHDLLGFYRTYRDRIQHVHLSNNAGKGWDSHLPVYAEGVLPVAEFLQEVTTDGFAGSIALELDLRPWLDDEDGLHDVLVRNREFCESHLSAQSAAGESAPAGR